VSIERDRRECLPAATAVVEKALLIFVEDVKVDASSDPPCAARWTATYVER
jgi:hypothetical protein